MSQNIFLQEMPATVAIFDVKGFSALASRLSPTDLAVALGSFYRHVERDVLEQRGRIVKFISDAALALFPSMGGADHAGNALRAVRSLGGRCGEWAAGHRRDGLPEMAYSAGVATGTVLHGELGTARLRAFDALGFPVTLATRLARLATVRGVTNLVAKDTLEAAVGEVPPCVEVESAEFAGELVRLYRVLSGDDETAAGQTVGKD